MQKYNAHVTEDGGEQTVLEHLQGTAALAEEFAAVFGAEEQGRLVGMAHDIGKYSDLFQKRLNGEIKQKVDHSTAGAYECACLNQNYAAFCVAGHHSGLPNKGIPEEEGTLCGRFRKAEKKEISDYGQWKNEVTLPQAGFSDFVGKDAKTDLFFVRMLYSCLVDADYLDTERFMNQGNVKRESGESIEVLNQKLQTYVSKWFPPKNVLNERRCDILKHCISGGKKEMGLYTLTVPTGGGKTVASLAFALQHAEAHHLSRVIYVVPYTSIIEQTAKTFREILGEENVLEHHCGIVYEADEEGADPKEIPFKLATENWDKPVIVTTAVQFFESLFANRSSKCRKLHNIAGSVIVFDEAQMIPVSKLKPCIYAISQLVKHYRVSAVLCTATQPALKEVFQTEMAYHPIELCPKELFVDTVFRRTTFENVGKISWETVAARMNTTNQILCIVNKRDSAQKVYEMLEGEGCYHLSTLLIPAERRRKLEEIRERLKMGKPCRVVSTSLIEAGVDVDFPQVMRELAGLDSILQAAGRCNREGKRLVEESIVTIFQSETKVPALFSMNVDVAKLILKRYKDPADDQTIQAYFDSLLQFKGEEALDDNKIMKEIESNRFAFQTIAEKFCLIDSETTPIFIPYGAEGDQLLHRRFNGEFSKSLLHAMGQYSVNVYETHLKEMYETGDVAYFEDGGCYLVNMKLYSEAVGLSLRGEAGKAYFV